MDEQRFPPGWDAERVQRLIDHYEAQTVDEEAQEIEDAAAQEGMTWMAVPTELVSKVRALIARENGA
jgi:hypothetical protein